MVSTTDASSERMIKPDLVVTGEAVALEIVPATIGNRLVSGLIDYGILAAGLFLTLVTWGQLMTSQVLETTSQAAGMAQLSLIVLLWVVAVPLAVETLSRGRSAGRLVTGTRVVRDDGGSVRLRHCLVRVLLSVVEVWILQCLPAVVTCVLTRRGKRLGDLLAGTYVIRERSGAQALPPLLMPAELSQWACEADLRALPGNLALVARTFLQRASSMDPTARARLGSQLAAAVAPGVAPMPPTGTHPERFLAAVLVERRERELRTELEDRARDDHAAAEAARGSYSAQDAVRG